MSAPIRFTVFRDKWITGDHYSSCLLRDDGKRCCLGHLARALGASDEDIRPFAAPGSTWRAVNWPPCLLGKNRSSALAFDLMGINDNEALSLSERERKLTALFAANGIDVEFRDTEGDV